MRVPVFVSHSEAVHVETPSPITPSRARELFAAVPGVVVQDDPAAHVYPLATEAAGSDEIFVGRVRQDPSIPDGRGLAFWVVSDNLRKGAATNAVEIAELIVGPRLGAPGLPASRGGMTEAERRTALEAIATRGPRLHRLPAPRRPHPGRAGGGPPVHRGRVRRRGPGLQRGPPGPAVRRRRRARS